MNQIKEVPDTEVLFESQPFLRGDCAAVILLQG